MTPRDSDTWFHLLVHLGVRPAVANVWSGAFSAIIPTSLFGGLNGLADRRALTQRAREALE